MNRKLLIAAALAVAAGAAWYAGSDRALPSASRSAGDPVAAAATPERPSAAPPHADVGTGDAAAKTAAAPAGGASTAPLSPAALAVLQQFERLRSLPPGDDAIALGRQIEAAITPDNAAGYVQALLQGSGAAVERSAIAALARGDSSVMQALAASYGALPPESRGRVLQVFENASNPAAIEGLAAVFGADASEKRSALAMSALYGIANIGNTDGVHYLLQQVTPAHADYALMALERVRSPQGVEMIRAAAAGSKDGEQIASAYRPALRRIADAAGKS